MTTIKPIDIAAKLQALREDYARRLPGELGKLNELVQQQRTQDLATDESQAVLKQLHQRLHKLAGSAGSFGFEALGRQAKQLELQVQRWLDGAFDAGHFPVFAMAVASLNHSAQAEVPRRPLAQKPRAEKAQSGTHVFLLEDDPAVAGEVCSTLRHFGHRVTHFATLAAAEAAIREVPPDFLVADIMFAVENRESPSLIAALQTQLAQPLPVIFISSREDFSAYHAAVKANAIGYFVKPLDVTRLVECLEHQIDRERETPFRIMIVDDDVTLAEHYSLVLSAAGMRVETVADPERVLLSLRDFKPEMILLDLHIPQYSGPELAKVIRLCDEWLRVPITYLSSETDIDLRIKAMGQAGDDFISKPISDRELIAAVSIRASRSRQLSEAMDRDGLTGLLKHSRIKEQVDIELARAKREDCLLTVAMIDLDFFKTVNDTYGHAAGDKVIKALAHLLRQRLRKTDAIGRYGGEEFVAVLPACGEKEAQQLLNSVRENFREISFSYDEKPFNVTLSAGLASTRGTTDVSADELLQRADEQLYQAKRDGRDRVCSIQWPELLDKK